MRSIIMLAALLICGSLHADIPNYSAVRTAIDERLQGNVIPKEESVFVGSDASPAYAVIVRYQKGITLRDIIDQTPFKGTTVTVLVVRPAWSRFITVKPSEKPEFEVQRSDAVWIYTKVPLF